MLSLPVIRAATPSPQVAAKLVEVKGPRDRLNEQQRSWCFELSTAGVEVGPA